MTYKILLVDDHAIVRQGYSSLIQSLLENTTITETSSGSEALKIYQKNKIDLVVLDINLQDISGIEVARRIRTRDTKAKILFFSMHDDASIIHHALETGALGYVSKECNPDNLIQAVQTTLQNSTYIEPRLIGKQQHATKFQHKKIASLTEREFEIFHLTAQGKSSEQIAELLHISKKTVFNNTSTLKQKLAIHSSAEIVHLAIDIGLISIAKQDLNQPT